MSVLMVTLMANSAFAIYYWDVDASRAPLVGDWSNANNWKATNSTAPTAGNSPQFTPPMGDAEMQAYGTGTGCGVTINVTTMNTYPTPTTGLKAYSRIFGGVTMNVLEGGIDGMGWLRVGETSKPGISTVNQSAGLMNFRDATDPTSNPARLTLGDGNSKPTVVGDGIYNISGGTLTYTKTSADGTITIGDRQGKGTLHVIGTGGTIDMGALELGGRFDKTGRQSDGTVAFDIVAGGVSAVQVARSTSFYAASTTHLTATLTEALANYNPIVLVKNAGAAAVNGVFGNVNGGYVGDAYEGAWVDIGMGVMAQLTYVYDCGDGTANDIALIVPEPATLALLSLGMFIIRRKK
jgi:hypothetical protein